MKKLYRMVVELETYFVADDSSNLLELGKKYIDKTHCGSYRAYRNYLQPIEVKYVSQISDRGRDTLVHGTANSKGEHLFPQEVIMKAFL